MRFHTALIYWLNSEQLFFQWRQFRVELLENCDSDYARKREIGRWTIVRRLPYAITSRDIEKLCGDDEMLTISLNGAVDNFVNEQTPADLGDRRAARDVFG